LGDCFSKIGITFRGIVASEPRVDRIFTSLDDFGESAEVWLSDFQMNDISAFFFEGGGKGHNTIGSFGAESFYSRCEIHTGSGDIGGNYRQVEKVAFISYDSFSARDLGIKKPAYLSEAGCLNSNGAIY